MLAAVSIMGGTPVSCEEKYPRHIQANWFAPFVKTTFVIALWRGRCDSPHQGAGLPDEPWLFLIMRCTPTIHELIVLTLPPRHRCPFDRLPASRLLLPRSGLERSNFVPWHF
jgi:hypothetical protein